MSIWLVQVASDWQEGVAVQVLPEFGAACACWLNLQIGCTAAAHLLSWLPVNVLSGLLEHVFGNGHPASLLWLNHVVGRGSRMCKAPQL